MNTIRKRLLSLFLCFVLIAGMLPVGALANETGEAATPEITEVTETLTQTASETEELSVSTETSEEESEQTDVSKKDERDAEKAEKKEEKAAEKEAKQEEKAAAKAAEASTDPSSEATEPSSEATEPSTEATEPAVIAVTGITLDQSALEVGVGELPMTLTATVLPEDATDKTVTWESSEPGVASVEDGVLTFGYMGEAVITATAGGFSASCTVKVGEGDASVYTVDYTGYIDAVIFGSDVHGNTDSSNNDYYLENVLAGAVNNGLTYSAIGFVGDTALPISTVASTVNSALGYNPYLAFSYASAHDDENQSDMKQYWDWSGEVAAKTGSAYSNNYYIYSIRQDDMTSSSNASTAANAFTSWVETADHTKPVFIISHIPMHDARDDNNGAAAWFDAIQAAGDKMDIVFFWGHNHTEESKGTTRTADQNAYYVAKDGTEILDVYNGNDAVPSFTYMNAGYINANNQSNIGRLGRMTSVALYSKAMVFQDYTTSGEVDDAYSHNVTVAREFAATTPVVTEQTFYSDDTFAAVTATAENGTVTDISDENDTIVNAMFQDAYWFGYNFALTGQVADTDTTITLWLDPDAMFSSDLAVYYYNETTGAYEAVTGYTVDTDEYNVEYITISNAALGTYVYGTPNTDDIIPDGATLTRLDITGPEKTKYFLSEDLENGNVYLDITGLTVAAVYTLNGAEYTKTLDWNQFDETVDGYALSFDDLTTKGEKTVKVTYGDVSGTFTVWVCEDEVVADDVTVSFDTESVIALTVETVEATETITTAVADVITGDVTVYSFTPTYANGDTALTGKATVTLPIPEGVTNPAVYYVSDDGATVEKMPTTVNKDGTLTFTTTHFSTYVVGENTEIDVPENETATGSGTVEGEPKTVYVLSSGNPSGSVMIVNGNSAGSGYYAVANNNGSVAATGVTIKSGDVDGDGDTETYIELDDATDELWTVAGNYTFQCEDGYLYRASTQNNSTYVPRIDDSSTTWSYNTNNHRLSYTRNSYTYYLYYSSGWKVSTSTSYAGSIYFYVPQEIDTTTTVSGTYSIAGNPASYDNVAAIAGNTLTLGSTLIFTPESGDATTEENPEGVDYAVYEGGDPNGVISGINGNTLTLSGETGKALVKVSYVTDFGTVTDYITVTATTPVYDLAITNPASTELKIENTLTLAASATLNGNAIENVTGIRWSSSNSDIARVDASTGEVTGVANGTAVITAAWTDPNSEEHTDTVRITVVDSVYVLDIEDTDGVSVTKTIVKKSVTSSTTHVLTVAITTDGKETAVDAANYVFVTAAQRAAGDFAYEAGKVYWTVSNDAIISDITFAENAETGLVEATITFTGTTFGAVNVSTVYNNKYDTVTITTSPNEYYTVIDGGDDFPEYPLEGSININKTATAVGNFSETGIAQIELYGNGVPVNTKGLDVIVPIDWTDSMSAVVDNGGTTNNDNDDVDRYDVAVEALRTFITSIMVDEKDQFTGNRVILYVFKSSNVKHFKLNSATGTNMFETVNADTIKSITDSSLTTNKAKLEAWLNDNLTVTALNEAYSGNNTVGVKLDSGYTNTENENGSTFYSYPLKAVYDKFSNATYLATTANSGENGANRAKACVFMSDGGPSGYYYAVTSYTKNDDGTYTYTYDRRGDSTIGGWVSGNETTGYTYSGLPELYSLKTKLELGIPIYSVGLGVETPGKPYSSYSVKKYSTLVNGILDGIASDIEGAQTYYPITDDGAGDGGLSKAFEDIAASIKQAASNVTVYDTITPEYELIFELPAVHSNGTNDPALSEQEFYIEVVNYVLDENYNRTGTTTNVIRLYLDQDESGNPYITGVTDGTSARVDYTQNNQPTITLEAKSADKSDGYFNWTDADSDGVVDANEITYVSNGTGAYKLKSGAFVTGNNTDGTMLIATTEFIYDQENKSFTWTTDKLGDENQIALRYFVYLTGSVECVENDLEPGDEGYVEPKAYNTNTSAWIAYTNHLDHLCYQYFPVPQLTWNGAQVTYVFYLVDDDGFPVNKAGTRINFTNSVEVTDRFTESVVWNDDEGTKSLDVQTIAAKVLPEYYTLYDNDAVYEIHVYQDETGEDAGTNYFQISGSKPIDGDDDGITTDTDYTTKVYMDKSSTKYDVPGYYTKNGGKFTDANKTEQSDSTQVETGFDFADTTVAFAVLWTPELQSDAVVVDYGLDVVIDVTANDYFANSVNGISATVPEGNVTMNTGVGSTSFAKANISTDNYTVSIESANEVRFSQNSMEFSNPVTFYYDSAVTATQNGAPSDGYMYSSVTVIPATTVYYEDTFVDLTTETKTNDEWTTDETSGWTSEGTQMNATQAQDRPGASKISAALDADNNYGYDAAYSTMSQYSLGSSAKVNVYSGHRAKATFEFYGTGFDVISLTSNTTGTIMVNTYAWDENTGTYSSNVYKSYTVDTYYGYVFEAKDMNADGTVSDGEGEWVISENTPNALYQVPVMKISGLPYGKYKAEIVAAYGSLFDHNESGNYDFYLDAIRIYDPTGVASGETKNETVQNAYLADGEAWPIYEELRNNIISGTHYTVTENENGTISVTVAEGEDNIGGAIFIDCNDENTSIADYVSYGPNNELYLANNQAIAFNVAVPENVADIQLGIKVGNGNTVTYEINGDSYTVETATDMYYSILDYALEKVNISAFAEGVSYFTKNDDGTYSVVSDDYDEGTTYYKAGTVTIKNVSGGILSLTNIKVTHTSNPYAVSTANFLWMDGDSVGFALKSLRPAAEEEVPETSEPEVVEPETTEPDEPETETTVPDETEPEETVPETTEPDKSEQEKVEEAVKEAVTAVVNTVVNALKNLFSRWFR